MDRGKAKVFGVIVIVILAAVWLYKTYTNPKLTPEENLKVISLVNSYYNEMMDKDYESALKLVDLSTSDYDMTVSLLNNNKDFSVQRSLEGNSWIIPGDGREEVFYDKQSKSFFTQISALIINKSGNYAATENVYVKKVGKDFKITKIITDDRLGYIRGSFVNKLPSAD